jgi:dihydroorotase
LASFDLVIEDAHVFVDGELVEANLGVENGIIAAMSKGALQGTKKLRLPGKVVLPGIVDSHAHIRDPGFTYKEDFETASRAAAAGGVTMFVDMPNCEPPTNSLKTFEEKKKIASRKSIVDFNHLVFPTPSEIPKVAGAGAAGFKIFMVRGAYPHDPRLCVEDNGVLLKTFAAISETGLPCFVHPSNMSLFEVFYEQRRKLAPKEAPWISFGKSYVEEEIYGTCVSTLIMLAKRTGVRLHLVHTHSETSIGLIKAAKQAGYSNISAQVDPKYFITNESEFRRLGPLVLPGGLLPKHRVETVWEAMRTEVIDVLATDHAPHTRKEIIENFNRNPWEAPFGCPQLEHYLSVFLNEVNKGTLTLAQLVKLATANPSRLLGIYPRKGAIMVGSDADFAIIDMKKERVLSSEGVYTKVGFTPYEGRRVKGVPVMTIRRGEIIMEDGVVLGKPGSGSFVAPLQVHKSKRKA